MPRWTSCDSSSTMAMLRKCNQYKQAACLGRILGNGVGVVEVGVNKKEAQILIYTLADYRSNRMGFLVLEGTNGSLHAVCMAIIERFLWT